MSDEIEQYWQPAPEAAPDLACAYLQVGRTRAHVHEQWQFAVPEMSSRLSVGAFRRYVVRPTDVTVVAPHDVHLEAGAIKVDGNWHILYVSPSALKRLWSGVVALPGVQAPQFTRPVLPDPAAALELQTLLHESEQGLIGEAEFVARSLRWIEGILRRYASPMGASSRPAAVERARAYLQQRATQRVTLAEVGAVAGVTVSHLVRSFSRSIGLPPKSYHAQLRLARAQRLLAEGKATTWVAYECGFADQSHLSRRFKECYGLTPGMFQAQYRGARSRAKLNGTKPRAA